MRPVCLCGTIVEWHRPMLAGLLWHDYASLVLGGRVVWSDSQAPLSAQLAWCLVHDYSMPVGVERLVVNKAVMWLISIVLSRKPQHAAVVLERGL
jgi:hypothetical protein